MEEFIRVDLLTVADEAWVRQYLGEHATHEECVNAFNTYHMYRDEGQSAEVSRRYAGLC